MSSNKPSFDAPDEGPLVVLIVSDTTTYGIDKKMAYEVRDALRRRGVTAGFVDAPHLDTVVDPDRGFSFVARNAHGYEMRVWADALFNHAYLNREAWLDAEERALSAGQIVGVNTPESMRLAAHKPSMGDRFVEVGLPYPESTLVSPALESLSGERPLYRSFAEQVVEETQAFGWPRVVKMPDGLGGNRVEVVGFPPTQQGVLDLVSGRRALNADPADPVDEMQRALDEIKGDVWAPVYVQRFVNEAFVETRLGWRASHVRVNVVDFKIVGAFQAVGVEGGLISSGGSTFPYDLTQQEVSMIIYGTRKMNMRLAAWDKTAVLSDPHGGSGGEGTLFEVNGTPAFADGMVEPVANLLVDRAREGRAVRRARGFVCNGEGTAPAP